MGSEGTQPSRSFQAKKPRCHSHMERGRGQATARSGKVETSGRIFLPESLLFSL